MCKVNRAKSEQSGIHRRAYLDQHRFDRRIEKEGAVRNAPAGTIFESPVRPACSASFGKNWTQDPPAIGESTGECVSPD